MIPRKFIAATSREALYRVREALGDEAIILSNKQVSGGVEIIAVSEHEMDAFAHEANVHSQHSGRQSEEERVFQKTSSWSQEIRAQNKSAGGRVSAENMGAASHYQHWENVSWNPDIDEMNGVFSERLDAFAPEPISDLNRYWQSNTPGTSRSTASASSDTSSYSSARSPVLAESVKTTLPPWMTSHQPAATVLTPTASSSLSSASVPPSFSTPASYPFMGNSSDLKVAGSAPLAATTATTSLPPSSASVKNASPARKKEELKEDKVQLSAAVSDPNAIPVSYFHSLNKAKNKSTSEDMAGYPFPNASSSGGGRVAGGVSPDKATVGTGGHAESRSAARSDGASVVADHSFSTAMPSSSSSSSPLADGRKKSMGNASQASTPSGSMPPLADVSAPAHYEDATIQHELKLLRSMLEGQLAGFAWNELSQRSPLHLTLMRWMLGAGISPVLSREILGGLRPTQDIMEAMEQVRHHLARRLDCMPMGDDIIDKGGVYALVGTTGVGKTTTVAKLAARCTLKHGPQHVALLTTDSYRIGAHDQLKAYGRILSVPVYGIRDESDLMSALSDLSSRRLLLIDTIGMSQRDRRLVEQIALLGRQGGKVQQLLLIAANAQASTLEDIVRAYDAAHISGVIMSKMDESTQIGSVVDILVRHRLRLCYYTDGQRVPEDLHLPDAKTLVDRVFQDAHVDSPFALSEHEYPLAWK